MKNQKLAIDGGVPEVTEVAPKWPVTGKKELKWMAETVTRGKWSWMGEHEKAFCEEYKKFIGTKYCACLANGTVTIQCALQAVGVVPGDEVIVPGMTWVATAQAALDIGANVVLVDVDPVTLCIDPEAVKKAITPKTKAIIPVHIYGCMCDMDAIMAIARKHKLKVVEDVAHQHGSQWRNKKAGAIGDAGSYSFQQSKILTSGEGGAVTCNSKEVYDRVFALKQVGWRPRNSRTAPYESLTPGNLYGHNYRITEMQAVLLRGGLSRLDAQNRKRDENAMYIAEKLKKAGGPLQAAPRDKRVKRQAYYAMTFYYDPDKAEGVTKDMYSEAVRAEKASLGPLYSPVYNSALLNLYDDTSPVPFRDRKKIQNYRTLKLPNVEKACNETGLLMTQTQLLGNKKHINQIIRAITKVNDNLKAVKEHFAKKK